MKERPLFIIAVSSPHWRDANLTRSSTGSQNKEHIVLIVIDTLDLPNIPWDFMRILS